MRVNDIDGLIPELCRMAPAFDPETDDDGTAWFDFGCEMEGWMEERGDTPTQFPQLKADYEADAEGLHVGEAEDEEEDDSDQKKSD